MYNFKKITKVPTSDDFVDIVLSRTQRKTPTVIHPNYAIHRIRQFYMRKVKFMQVSIHDKLTQMLEEFPRLDDVHPFYADLLNVLYDKDHYKLALGQIHIARGLIDNCGRDYVKLLKYGDSLYRCKCLKRAALGRMVTILKKQKSSLGYLEQVRQHMARLPSIDPSTRTLIVCGYPNVGKSSFLNKITRAAVDVQDYAFTTKSLFVGHTDYKNLTYQVIDTPGLLDTDLEQKTTIEMQGITALAHLRACVLYFLDLSCTCGYGIQQQLKLFQSIHPLLANKPKVLVMTKVDIQTLANMKKEDRETIENLARTEGMEMVEMSNKSGEGLGKVKQVACELLLKQRVEEKLSKGGKKMDNVLNRLHVAQPSKEMLDSVPQEKLTTSVPDTVSSKIERNSNQKNKIKDLLKKRSELVQKMRSNQDKFFEEQDEKTMELEDNDQLELDNIEQQIEQEERFLEEMNNFELEKDIVDKNGGRGVYSQDFNKNYLLENDEWKYDKIPEIMDGKNIADFVDPNILQRLEELEKEEEKLIYVDKKDEKFINYAEHALTKEEEAAFKKYSDKLFEKKHIRTMTRRKKAKLPRKVVGIDLDKVSEELKSRGVSDEVLERARQKTIASSKSASKKRSLSKALFSNDPEMRARSISEKRQIEEVQRKDKLLGKRKRSMTPATRSLSQGKLSAFKNEDEIEDGLQQAAKRRRIQFGLHSSKGESDRYIYDEKPKHLLTGKMNSAGKRDRR